jgi:hypothetical protein
MYGSDGRWQGAGGAGETTDETRRRYAGCVVHGLDGDLLVGGRESVAH